MNYKMMGRIIALVVLIETALMLPALLIAAVARDGAAAGGFLISMGIMLAGSSMSLFLTRNAPKRFFAREGMVCVGMCWVVLSLLGALPFFLSGRVPNYVDAFFETVSGFTTTGASILTDVEALGHGLLFWRSFTHWVGGMGILVFFLAIVPISGNNEGFTLHILRAESPGPSVNKMVPRMRRSAAILYWMYVALTVLDIICLLIARMPVFDAFCIAFGTAGTGGFGVLNSGCATYPPAAQNVTTVFMILFGVNFGCYYLLILRNITGMLKDEELRAYLLIILAAAVLIAFNIYGKTPDTMGVEPTVRHSAFTVGSIITTTGFSTTDFDLWPSFSKAILLVLMFCGASAGSTGGGIKVVRVLLLLKGIKRNAHHIFHPQEVQVIRFNGARVGEETMSNLNAYLAAYVFIVIGTFLILSADPVNYSVSTNFSAVMATFNNIGPGIEAVGPTQNFSGYCDLSKLVMSAAMLLGRLEIFPIFALFMPSTFRRGF